MLDLTTIVLVIAGLLIVIAALQPLAERLKIPSTVLLAAVGVVLGTVASFLLRTPLTDRFNEIVEPIVNLPIGSTTFLYIFLPLLLFQAALTIDVPRMKNDSAPILLLAVVAVVVTTVAVGASVAALFGQSLVVCLLLGAIVATTDPAAVVGIFRDIGAPARLARLVEGESLLNDAAAIALFALLLAMIIEGQPLELEAAAVPFAYAFAGGIGLGWGTAKALLLAVRHLHGLRAAETTLTLAAPYVAFIAGDQFFGVSGVVAVVVLGLSVSASGRSVFVADNWRHLLAVWDQIAFWASSLVFILAALVVPKLLGGMRLIDAAMVLTVVVAALIARALVLFVLLPLLSGTGLTKPVDHAYKTAILWGGLRGAVTLALALAVLENPLLPADVKRLVAVGATGFVLFTLFVNGTTLRPMIRLLKLDRLTLKDQALRDQVLALALTEVRDSVRDAGRRYALPPDVLTPVVDRYEARLASAAVGEETETLDALPERERLAVALTALANRERELILEHHAQQAISPVVIGRLLRHAERIVEAARAEGRIGYNRAARRVIEFRPAFRRAHFLHRHFRIDGLLARQLAQRFEVLEALSLTLRELTLFNEVRLKPLFGERIGALLKDVLDQRTAATESALEALRLQYPSFAKAVAQRFLHQLALSQELANYDGLFREGLIDREVYESLRRSVLAAGKAETVRPTLDLGLKIPDMLDQFELFRGLTAEERRKVCRLFRSRLALPGEVLIRRGEKADKVFFISSGAVMVRLPDRTLRRGRGEYFGELALLQGTRRFADIVALTYCQLLVLDEARFERFLKVNPGIRHHVEAVAQARLERIGAPPEPPTAATTGEN